MGVSFAGLINGEIKSISDFSGKTLVVDAFNMLYQFITTIRGPDGRPLTDSSGNITSHLVGLFARTTKLMQEDIKLIFVFDGKAPELKKKERERRKQLKLVAQKLFDKAKEEEDVSSMAKYASRTARLTPEMVSEAKDLLVGLGIPFVTAPSEGEAQAAYMVKKGDAYAVISQDYDSLLFGTPYVIKNLSISARKKKLGTLSTTKIEPELLSLSEVLADLNLTKEQLIYLGMIIGTDFNIGGIKGLGPKKGLKTVTEMSSPDELFKDIGWSDYFDYDWKEVFNLFVDMPVTDDYSLVWSGVDDVAIKNLLVEKHNFSEVRVNSVLTKLDKLGLDRKQKGLNDFF